MSTSRVWGVDPAPDNVAWACVSRGPDGTPALEHCGQGALVELLDAVSGDWRATDVLYMEVMQSYGAAVGGSVFRTCEVIGEARVELRRLGVTMERMTRIQAKRVVCGTVAAKDPDVRAALIDRFPATGGGRTPQVGTKAQPGPLRGVAGDRWAALAIAIAGLEGHT